MADTALDMEPLRGFANYGARELARLTDSAERSARRWIKHGLAPRIVVRFLRLLSDGTLGEIRPQWDGWTLRSDGRLHSPDGPSFTPHELTAYGLNMQLLRELQRERESAALALAKSPGFRARREPLPTTFLPGHHPPSTPSGASFAQSIDTLCGAICELTAALNAARSTAGTSAQYVTTAPDNSCPIRVTAEAHPASTRTMPHSTSATRTTGRAANLNSITI